MKILNFGSCNIDFVYSLNHIVNAGETETSGEMNIFPGGKGLNQSIALARAGAKVFHAGCVGEDGELLTDILRKNGVDISNVEKVSGKNGHAIIQVSKKGENSIVIYPGSNRMITRDMVELALEEFSGGDIVLLQNEINQLDYIVQKAYEKKMCIVFNPSPCDSVAKSVDLNKITYLVLNEIEAQMLTGCKEPELSLKYFAEKYSSLKVVLTLGKNGCIFYNGEREIYQSAYSVNVVDTTAAGDTFTGFFIANAAMGVDEAKALKIASAAAAIAVSRNGAASSIPTSDEVLSVINSMKTAKSDKCAESLESKIEKYTEQNLKTASLCNLAKALGYSQAYTSGLVKSLTGKPFSVLIQQKRCSAAARLLVETDLSISEIISSVGYENESFFRNVFREKYGKNMLEYRKFIRGAENEY